MEAHKFENYRLFYDEGTPHVWDIDESTFRLYSDNLKRGVEVKFYPKWKYSYLVSYYSVRKDGSHYTMALEDFETLDEVVTYVEGLKIFSMAIEEFTSGSVEFFVVNK